MTDFSKVDVGNVDSIMSYGDEAIEEISGLLDFIVANEKNYDELRLDDADIKEITDFYITLEEYNNTFSKRKTFLAKIKNKQQYKIDELAFLFNNYYSKIENIRHVIESQKADCVYNFIIRKKIMDKFPAYIELLEEIINVGVCYINKNLSQEEFLKYQDNIKLFENKLDYLKLTLYMYKKQYTSYLSEQRTELNILNMCSSYLNYALLILLSQASSILHQEKQKKQAAVMISLNSPSHNDIVEMLIDKNIDNDLDITPPDYSITGLSYVLTKCLEIYQTLNKDRKENKKSEKELVKHFNIYREK